MTAIKTSQIKPKAQGGKKLMSELLTDTCKYIEQAEKTNIEQLRHFFHSDPERPLIAMGHGGSHSSAAYAALLYGTNCALGRAVTPYQANSISDTTFRHSKLLLFSSSLMNQDAIFIANRMAQVNPQHSCVLTMTGKENDNIRRQKTSCPNGIINYPFECNDGFIAVNSTFTYFSLLYKAFTGDRDFAHRLVLSSEPCDNYTYRCAEATIPPPSLSTITHLTVLYGSYGEPVAHKMESYITEAGLASCVLSDYRDECHGRFLALSNFIHSKRHHGTDCALVLLVTPREEALFQRLLKQMPGHLPVVIISTDFDSPLASIDLLYKMSVFTSHFGEEFRGSNPNDPVNLGGIDKRAFRNNVPFIKELKQYGPLQLYQV